MRITSRMWSVLALLLAIAGAGGGADARTPPKFIATGWDHVDQKGLREYVAEMEKRPFQGVMMTVVGRRDNGTPCALRYAQSAEPWKREWFKGALADLKATHFKQFTDNFVSIGANPGNVDWFDDAGWANVVQHWAIAAWIAHEAGFRGILFDPEPYHKPFRQFCYGAQAGRDAHTFEEYREKARQRGREVMRAVTRECPGLTIFCYFMNSVNLSAARAASPQAALEGSNYGLFPAFIDGWLDVIPPDVTLVDGCESAYLFHDEKQYLRAALQIKGDCQSLVSPENRYKYRAQVQVSFGVYLDAYWNPPNSKWSRWRVDCGKRKPVEQLLENLRHAAECCDQYVWIYGEKFRWWPTANGRVFKQSWPEALPGVEEALRLARDPLSYARYLLKKDEKLGTLKNLARNGDFQSATARDNTGVQADWRRGGAPAGWNAWQMRDGKGTLLWDRKAGAAKASGVPTNGCFIQSYEVKPGETYAVRARTRVTGRSKSWLRIRWQTADGHWTHERLDVIVTPGKADPSGWSPLFGAATVPDDTGKLVLLLGMGNQLSKTDSAWFDDVQVYRLAGDNTFKQNPVRWDLKAQKEH